jgi:CBS domain-containing protein
MKESPMKVREAMHKGVQWVSPETKVSELAKLMRDHDIGAIPIGENDRLIGMVTDRDIVCRALANGSDASQLTARQIMTPGIAFCRDEEELAEAVRIMEARRVRRLPVIDGTKRMVGLLSIGDVAHTASRELTGELLHAVATHH